MLRQAQCIASLSQHIPMAGRSRSPIFLMNDLALKTLTRLINGERKSKTTTFFADRIINPNMTIMRGDNTATKR